MHSVRSRTRSRSRSISPLYQHRVTISPDRINKEEIVPPVSPSSTDNHMPPATPTIIDKVVLAAPPMNNTDSFVCLVPNSSITDKAVSPVPTPKTGDVPPVNIDTETKCVTHNESETDKKLSTKPARTRQSRSDSADVGRRTLAKQRANRSLSKTRLKQTTTAEEPKDKPKKKTQGK